MRAALFSQETHITEKFSGAVTSVSAAVTDPNLLNNVSKGATNFWNKATVVGACVRRELGRGLHYRVHGSSHLMRSMRCFRSLRALLLLVTMRAVLPCLPYRHLCVWQSQCANNSESPFRSSCVSYHCC